ncbi:MAG: LysM peptidoglycan-binding domain-containing protein [Nanoarchaeota archaeon]
MGLEDFLKNMDESSDHLEFQKAYYEEIKKSSKKLNLVRLQLYTRIKSNEICKKTVELYNNFSNDWKKRLGYSAMAAGLTLSLHSVMYPSIDGFSRAENEEKKIEKQSENTQMAEGEEPSSFSSNTITSPSASLFSRNEQTFPLEKEKTQKNQGKLMTESDYVYFTVRGDNLSKIARNVTGDMDNWTKILRYNNLDNSDIKKIEVNQPIVIPESLAQNRGKLFDGVLVREVKYFDGVHAPLNYVQARSGEDLRDISNRVYGTPNLSSRLFDYNRELNSRFSSTIYDKEYIFLPPKSYLKK